MGKLSKAVAVLGIALASPGAIAADTSIYTYRGADRDAKVLAGAKKEGKVTLYSGMIIDYGLRTLSDNFNKQYPDVKFEFWRGDTREMTQKVTAEQRSGRPVADAVEASGIAGPIIKAGAVQPFTTPVAAAYGKQHVSKDNYYVAMRLSYFGLAYNTKEMTEAAVPKTYKELVDPKYKNKLSWRAQSDSGSDLFIAAMLKSLGDQAGEAYLKELAKQNVVNYTGSARALVDRVGQGEYPLAIGIFAHHPIIVKAAGAPVDVQMMEPIPSVFSTVSAIKGSANPHATMLLIDYMLSKEFQTAMLKADYFSARNDVEPEARLHKIIPRYAKMEEVALSSEEVFDNQDKIQKIYEWFK
jgi:ABC-type Fe3+ transport system substrate-binding protein